MSSAYDVEKAKRLSGDQPWNQDEIDNLGPTIMQFMEDHEPFYKRWAETWFNNFQFIYGNQAVRWSKRYGYAVDVDYLQRLPALNQRAQTNIARIVAEALSSMIYANLPEWDVEASDESSIKGRRFRRIIQKILDAYMVRLNCDIEFSNAAMIYTVFGQVGFQIDWDPMGGRLLEIPKWKKNRAPVYTDYMAPNPVTMGLIDIPTQMLNSSGDPLFEERWEPVLDQMGRQLVDKFFAGDVRLNTMTPMEYHRGISSSGMHNTKYIERILLLDYDDFLTRYGSLSGKTKYWNQVQPVYSSPWIYRIAMRHFMRMQFTTPPGLSDLTSRPDNVYKSSLFRNKVLVIEHFDKPHPLKWPLGRRVIVANGQATHVTVPQYDTGRLDGWHPFIEAQWLTVPPNSLSAGPMNDVVAKNRELNIADSLIATALRRNMGSQLLIKTGAGMDPQRFTGEPGIVHEVPDPHAARWLHDDMPIPQVIPSLREQYKEDVFESSGAGDALRGDRSKGVSSGYGQRIIQEREERRLAPARKKFEQGIAGVGEKIYTCLKTNVVKLDDDVMGFLTRAAAGEFTPSDVVAMMQTPVKFGVEIVVTSDSMALNSKATQQATLNELATNNPAVQQRLATNAKALDEYLKFFDAESLRDNSAAHRDRAQRENEQFLDLLRLGPEALSSGAPCVLFRDDDMIHGDEHTDLLVTHAEEIMRNEWFFKYLMEHINRHEINGQEKAGQAQPGTGLQTGGMMAAAEQIPKPTVTTIWQNAIMKQQQQALSGPSQSGGAPTQPAPMGSGGPPQQSTATPAAKTPAGQQQGG